MEFNYDSILYFFALPLYSLGLAVAATELFFAEGNSKSNFAHFISDILNILTEVTLFALLGVSFFSTSAIEFKIFEFGNGIFTLVAAFFLYDFFFYCEHFLMHRTKFLWSFHQVHHSSSRYGLSLGFRISWFRSLRRLFFFYPMFVIGFDGKVILSAMAIVNAYGFFVHLASKLKFPRWLGFAVSPHLHSIHHEASKTNGVNLGGVLTLWDHAFGTGTDWWTNQMSKRLNSASTCRYPMGSNSAFNAAILGTSKLCSTVNVSGRYRLVSRFFKISNSDPSVSTDR